MILCVCGWMRACMQRWEWLGEREESRAKSLFLTSEIYPLQRDSLLPRSVKQHSTHVCCNESESRHILQQIKEYGWRDFWHVSKHISEIPPLWIKESIWKLMKTDFALQLHRESAQRLIQPRLRFWKIIYSEMKKPKFMSQWTHRGKRILFSPLETITNNNLICDQFDDEGMPLFRLKPTNNAEVTAVI